LAEAHRTIGLALGGEPGSRVARHLAMPTSPDTLLRRVRAIPAQPIPTPRVLGVDDFAFRKGSVYGTILVDLEGGRVLELLPDREAATLAGWLRGHTGVQVISRDRASAYAQAAREAAPEAVQVADRWHLLANLRDALERFLQRRSATIRRLLAGPSDSPPASPEVEPAAVHPDGSRQDGQAPRRECRQARFEQVRQLHADGMSLRGIARALGLHYQTVERYVRSDTCPDWQPGRRRPSLLGPYEGFIRQRLEQEHLSAAAIHRALRVMGCRCGKTIVKQYVRGLKPPPGGPGRAPEPSLAPQGRPVDVSFRQLAVAIVRRPHDRSAEDQQLLAKLGAGEAVIAQAIEMAEQFAGMVRGRGSADLGAWFDRAAAGGVAEIKTLARGLRQDEAAVRAGMDLEWSNGPVEGHVNRLKLVKRTMYGRAGFELLRARVLNAG
jgi:transposase